MKVAIPPFDHYDDLPDENSRQFLRMIQTVDGYANISRNSTTLKELRLFNFHAIPCTDIAAYGVRTGFFRTIRTLRVSMSYMYFSFWAPYPYSDTGGSSSERSSPTSSILDFFALFSNLECLHWLHLCDRNWNTGARVGADEGIFQDYPPKYWIRKQLKMSHGKIKTLVVDCFLSRTCLLCIPKSCPKLEYLSITITWRIAHMLHILIETCQQLKGLEMYIDERNMRFGKEGWIQLGKAIPRSHPKLNEVAIHTVAKHNLAIKAPVRVVIDCFTEVVKRVGRRGQKLVFRAGLRSRRWSRIWHGICRVLESCTEHSWLLRQLVLELYPLNRSRLEEDFEILLGLHKRMQNSRDMAVRSLPYLNKLDLGLMHFWSNEIT